MNRWILAVATLVGVAVVAAHADYVIIKINLATSKDKEKELANKQQGGGGEGQPGMGGGPAGKGMPGGAGMAGGAGAPRMGGMGAGGGRLGGGGLAGGGGGEGAPGMGGRGMGMGGRGMQGMGMGMQGGMPGMGMGMQGGMQGMGMGMQGMGMGMGMGMGGRMTSRPGEEDEEDSIPIFVGAILEVERSGFHKPGATAALTAHSTILNKWGGKTRLAHPSQDIVWVHIDKLPTVAKRFAAEKAKIKEDDPQRAENLVALARWALEHGLVNKVPEVMDEAAQADDKHRAVVAFKKVQADMGRKISRDDPALGVWQQKLVEFQRKDSDGGHYALLYDMDGKTADRRLKQLEDNYRAFYYWFALRGKVLPVPDYRLVAFLVRDKETFEHQHKDIFDNTPTVADGFYAQRENLAVFAGSRLDEGYELLKTVNEPFFKAWKQDDLLKGGVRTPPTIHPEVAAQAETCTLVMKAMEEEAELEAISHEGTRQLIAAAGLLPRNVEAPRWLESGVASFFATSKGSPWPATGGVNVNYLTRFVIWNQTKSKNLEKTPEATLQAVLTDRYFREVSKDPKKRESELLRARALSWGLTYFLAHKKLDGLAHYYEELSSMPRDLEFDADVLVGCFGRAFGLADSSDPSKLDPERVTVFAREWYRFMTEIPFEFEELRREVLMSIRGKQTPTKPGAVRPGGRSGGGTGGGITP